MTLADIIKIIPTLPPIKFGGQHIKVSVPRPITQLPSDVSAPVECQTIEAAEFRAVSYWDGTKQALRWESLTPIIVDNLVPATLQSLVQALDLVRTIPRIHHMPHLPEIQTMKELYDITQKQWLCHTGQHIQNAFTAH